MGNAAAYLAEFIEKMQCAFSSEATIKNYTCAVRKFLSFAANQKEPSPSVLIRRYILSELQDAEAKTVNLHRSAIVKFFKLVKGIDIDTVGVPRRKEPKKLPRIVQPETVQVAIEKTNNLKHRLVLSIFYGCGIRLCEMQFMRRKNILIDRNIIWLEDTKGQKHRIVPIPESIRGYFYEFIKGMDQEQFVFGGLSKRCFGKIVTNAFARVGAIASPHMLRHGFATAQVTSGQSLAKVQAWMGHSNIKTTMIYLHLSEAQLSESTDILKCNYTARTGV